MLIICWNAPNVKYDTLEKQKLNSTLDSVTTEKMYGNRLYICKPSYFRQKLYLQHTRKMHTD